MSATTMLDERLSQRARHTSAQRPAGGTDNLISFAGGFPDSATLPFAELAEAATRTMREHGEGPLQYGPTFGYADLLDFLTEKLRQAHGIACGPENLMLTAGASQALGLLCELFVDPGDTVLSEAPAWMGAVRTFHTCGATVESVPLDADGVRVDLLEQQLAALRERGIAPKFFYTIPNFQNPAGMTTTLARRQAIVRLAAEYRLPVLEDDAYFDLRFRGETLPTLYALDGGRHVCYIGTFSKILAAGMRLGWIVADPALINRLGGLKFEGSTSPFAAHVAYEYCKDGRLDARVRELVAAYRRRCAVMLGELEERMPDGVTWTAPEGGFFVWLTLPDGVDAGELLPRARARGIDYAPGSLFFFDGDSCGDGCQHLRLSYSYVAEPDIARGIQILAELIREEAARA